MSNDAVNSILWWICLIIAPMILIAIELFHPAGFTDNPGMYEYLSKPENHTHEHKALYYFGPTWWFTLHMIQTPLVGLVALALWLLVDGIDRINGIVAFVSAWLSRAAFIAALFAAVALWSAKKAPWPPLIILIVFGWILQLSHASFHGPVAFGLLTISSLWIWLVQRRNRIT